MLLGIPGIITYFLLKKLIGKIGTDTTEVVLSIFVFAILSYLAADTLLYSISKVPCLAWLSYDPDFMLVKNLIGSPGKIDDKAIMVSTLCSVPVAGLLSFFYRLKVWNRLCQWARLSNRYGDEDVFNYFLDSELDAPRWYVVRDHKESLIYYGGIAVWSDEAEDRELLLAEVDVYSNQGDGNAQFLYSCSNLYLCRNRDDLSIELIRETPTKETNATGTEKGHDSASSSGPGSI